VGFVYGSVDDDIVESQMGVIMKRVLIIGETPLSHSQLATVLRELGFRLTNKNFQVACMALNHTGWPFTDSRIMYPIYPWVGPVDKPINLDEVLSEFKPDVLLLVGAPQIFKWLKTFEARSKYKTVLHTRFITTPIYKELVELYNVVDTVVVNTKFEKKAIESSGVTTKVAIVPPATNLQELKNPARR